MTPVGGSTNDGVNIPLGDRFSAYAGQRARETWQNIERFGTIVDHARGHFRGPRTFRPIGLPERIEFDLAPDGIGTKVIPIDVAEMHVTAASNLMAMCCGDVTRFGGLPLLFTNVLDVRTLGDSEDSPSYQRAINLIDGLIDAANQNGVAVYKGETAELGECVGSEVPDSPSMFNWAGTAFGLFDPKRMIIGETLREGQLVAALYEPTPRSNGLSNYRKALQMAFGKAWYKNPEAREAIEWAASPSTLYDKFLAELNGWFRESLRPHVPVHCIAHITGGGIPSKLGSDILYRQGLSADLDDLWEPTPMAKRFAEWRGLSNRERYSKWCCGQGVLLVIDESSLPELKYIAEAHNVNAKVCGKIVKKTTPQIRIVSKFDGEEVIYTAEDE